MSEEKLAQMPEDVSHEEALPEETLPEETLPEEASPEDVSPEDVSPVSENVAEDCQVHITPCPGCGLLLEGDLSFCPKCGTKIIHDNINDKIDAYNSALENKKQKKSVIKVIVGVVLGAMLVAGGILGVNYYYQQKEIQRQEEIARQKKAVYDYAMLAQEYCNRLNEIFTDLSQLDGAWNIINNTNGSSNYYYNYYYYSTRDALIRYVENSFSTQIYNINAAYDALDNYYQEINNTVPDDENARKIKEMIGEIHTAYRELYNNIIVSQNGNNTHAIANMYSKVTDLEMVINNVKIEYQE